MKKSRIRASFLCLLLCASTALMCACGSGVDFVPHVSEEPALKIIGNRAPGNFSAEICAYASAEERLEHMEIVASEGDLSLYFDFSTCDIALKKGEALFFSTPWDLSEDAAAAESQKKRIASQLHLRYLDSQQKVSEIYSFPECVSKGQYSVDMIEGGVRVNMVIGRAESRVLLPPVLPVGSFEKVMGAVSSRGATRLKAFFKLYDKETSPASQIESICEKYPIVEEMPIYVLKNTTDKEKSELEGYFRESGYTFEDYDRDLALLGVEELEAKDPRFEISVIYRLADGELSVCIPASGINYDEKQFSLLEIGVLEYFAAAPCTQDGYLFLPDGCGTVIGFNRDGSKLGNEIMMPVYGYDRSLSYVASNDNLMTACLPVYGIRAENGTLFAMIGQKSGAAMSSIVASSGGSACGYARAAAVFTYRDRDSFEYKDVNTQYSWTIAEKAHYTGTYEVRYALLEPGAGYSEMAAYYREKLALEDKVSCDSLPLTVGLLGSISHTDSVMFVPVKRQVALTTFADAAVIARELQDLGIGKLNLRYLGWSSGGLDGNAATEASVEKAIGGKKGLATLTDKLQERGVGLYLDADLAYVGSNKLFDSFRAVSDTGRMLDKTYAGYARVRLSSGLMNEKSFRYALTPSAALDIYGSFEKELSKLGQESLSLSGVGSDLNSDKNNKGGVTRDTALQYTEEILRRAGEGYTVMASGANGYVLPYADYLIETPTSASGYPDADYSVPFLQMLLHGRIEYTGGCVNLSGNYHDEVLKAIETGSGLYFEMAYRNTGMLKTSDHADLYSVDFAVWKDKIAACYRQVDETIGDLGHVQMVSYQVLREGVSKTTYANGTVIYVNYNSAPCKADGHTVQAKGYLRVEGGDGK